MKVNLIEPGQLLDSVLETEVAGYQEQIGIDILKALFNTTIFLGPLETPPNPEPTEQERNCWKRSVFYVFVLLFLVLVGGVEGIQ